MNRYSVREAPRAILMHELADHIRGEEHLHPEEPQRADALRRALQELEMGAPAARAGDFEFRINEDCTTRYGVSEGSQQELVADLERYAADRREQGKIAKAKTFEEAVARLEDGVAEIRVERVVYRVVEG